MAGYTRDEALALVDSMRILVGNRTGFKWMAGKLSHLSEYIESVSAENERLNAYVDHADVRADFEAYRAAADDDVEAAAEAEE